MVTAVAATLRAASQPGRLTAEALALREKFPPRPVPARWDATGLDKDAVLARLLASPFPAGNASTQYHRRSGLIKIMQWLQAQPGQTWQDRWMASGVDTGTRADPGWRRVPMAWLEGAGRIAPGSTSAAAAVGSGLLQLICGDVIRPSIAWLLTTTAHLHVAAGLARVRDPDGFAGLRAAGQSTTAGHVTTISALARVAVIMAAKGGTVRDITVGDALELMRISVVECDPRGANGKGPYFYQLLHAMGVFPPGAPSSVRLFSPRYHGQLTVEQLIDRYDLACRPVRDLLVDYLRERQRGLDYTTLATLACYLGRTFWKDLETHHPGIGSLDLAPGIAAAWKQRAQTKPARAGSESGAGHARVPRAGVAHCLAAIRAFYLDIAQWAAEDPARRAKWAARCPIRADDIQARKERSHRKSRMDQRTRERLPAVPALAASASRGREASAEILQAAALARPGEVFTAAGQSLRRPVLTRQAMPSRRIWGEDLVTGARRDLTREEDNAFWAWAAMEILRATGIRVEELTELSHHSLAQYRLPDTGETIPLLHIAPSKTDEERLLVIEPGLADVLATILQRIRATDGAVPLVISYDLSERVWNPPMPLLLQHRAGMENVSLGPTAIRRLLGITLAGAAIAGSSGQPLTFTPHDFRRIFTTDAIMNGMPPHIAQLILGHKDINTTMGYKAVYPGEAISGHRSFIARRRALRPSEEYRTPTDGEWEEFPGHFERRRVALGDCGRAYGTGCIHEHSCIRCPLLRIDPDQQPRLESIRASLTARITEAEREGWAGEAEGLQVSLAAATAKLAQADGLIARRNAAVHLGIPAYHDIAGRAAVLPASTSAPACQKTP
jgi:integrase